MDDEAIVDGIVQTEMLNEKSSFYLVSYYWGKGRKNKGSIRGLTYDEQVDRLIHDCRKAKVNYYFVRYPSLEQGVPYQDALGLKPKFIQYALDQFPDHKCIFVDTDLRLLRYPHLFEVDADCWFLNWNELHYDCYNPLQLELPGGVLGFANTHNARQLLKILTKSLNVRYAEDKTFSGVITRNFLNQYCRCVWLPENYMYMFSGHEYEPGKGYTKIVSYREELSNSHYSFKDIVIAHEDFETGALDDVFKEKVGRSRWPPNVDRQMGEKLRCYDIKFETYTDWGLTSEQQRQVRVDAELRRKGGLIRTKTVPKKEDFDFPRMVKKTVVTGASPFVVVSMVDNQTDPKRIKKFEEMLRSHNSDGVVYKVDDVSKTSKALLLYKAMRSLARPVLYMDIKAVMRRVPEYLMTKNMDFMMYNLNADFGMSKCYDPRILKAMNDDVLYFADNKITREFLLIWAKHTRKKHLASLQHKSLEYAFNVSNALNKLRCYWLPSARGERLGYDDYTKAKVLTRSLEQCGLKPARSEKSEPYYSHRYGSRGKRGVNKHGHKFL
jgi:hypothetical protein